ncbi:Nuclear nucleic acid-binding protein C1D [Gracilariopsis chorda]|uniref:Nuclear nucleic acid-binding protein C1D n=1 Tax=Gracilariopsis chorda TaxID=448386 RepID=A0A2V3J6P7_9FLOR|nr:Nuclear nucleic acid-binding protein C1D [Gracilariopsis chorda]|eukprot:PXF49050.1 Nuclear nucleic acid-binding protein C1D [Gracilariopsis chorda]
MERSHQQAQLALTKFSYAVEQLQRALRPVLSAIDGLRSSSNEEELDAISRTRMHISLAYAVNSLFCMYLRTQGIDPATHPIAEEIVRVQDAFMRMRKVEAGESTSHKQLPKRDRRKHIANSKKSAARLAALVFPEEDDLLRALQGKTRRPELEEAESTPQSIIHDDAKQNPADQERAAHEPQLEDKVENEQEKKDEEDSVILIESDSETPKSDANTAQEHSKDGATENHREPTNEEQETLSENAKPDSEEKHAKKKKRKKKDKDRKEKGKKKRKGHEEHHENKKKEKHERSRRKEKDTDTSKERKKRRYSESDELPIADKRENKKRKRNTKRRESN